MKADQYPQNRTNEYTLHVAQTERERERERMRKGVGKAKFSEPLFTLILTESHYEQRQSRIYEWKQGAHGKLSTHRSKMF